MIGERVKLPPPLPLRERDACLSVGRGRGGRGELMPTKRKKRVIIIGNSAAGLSALETFRKRERDSKVLMIDKEPVLAYSRVITPYFIMGGVKREEGLFLRTKDF